MRLLEITAQDVPPVHRFHVSDLSDITVFAGRNGIGKTRLLAAILNCLQNPVGQPNIHLRIASTCKEERQHWNKEELNTETRADAELLQASLQANRYRRNWKSSVINIESDRSIQKIDPYKFSFDAADPDNEHIGWKVTFSGLRNRYQDTIHSIFRKVHAHRNKISSRAEKIMREGGTNMDLDFPDPLAAFKTAFRKLLAPKSLLDADLKQQQLKYEYQGQEFPISSLSSGEREVVNIVFDFILRRPTDCIVFFDEPELHLHPELSYRLIQTLSDLGENNQFIFSTHSPDIITASLDHSVVFIGPPHTDDTNQALPVREDDQTNRALTLLGQSVGIIALGRKIVLIEGSHASLDKQTYGAILQEQFPNLVLVPSGGKNLIESFSTLAEDVLSRSLWGVEFFMLCDRDAIPPSEFPNLTQPNKESRLRLLGRYHIENYFLEENVLAEVFESIEPDGHWLRSATAIRSELRTIARSRIAHAVALQVSAYVRQQVGNVDIMPSQCHEHDLESLAGALAESARIEQERIGTGLDPDRVRSLVVERFRQLQDACADDSDEWKVEIPGRPILHIFASKANLNVGRLKRAYIKAAHHRDDSPFREIYGIFSDFDKM